MTSKNERRSLEWKAPPVCFRVKNNRLLSYPQLGNWAVCKWRGRTRTGDLRVMAFNPRRYSLDPWVCLLFGSRAAVMPGRLPQSLHITDRWYAEEFLILPVEV